MLNSDNRLMPTSSPSATEIVASDGDHGDDDGVTDTVLRHPRQQGQSGVDLICAEAERGGDAADGGDDRQHVDGVDQPGRNFREGGAQEGADAQGQPAVERDVGKREADHRVDPPSMQPPMQEHQPHGVLGVAGKPAGQCRVGSGKGAHRRVGEMHHRLGDAVEHQADAHAGAEQHREPCGARIFRARRLAAEPDVAGSPERQHHAAEQQDIDGQHQHPAKGMRCDRLHRAEALGGEFGIGDGGSDQESDERDRAEEHRRLELRSIRSD